MSEYLKIAGRRIGLEEAELKLRQFTSVGIGIEAIGYSDAVEAGKILCRNPRIPIADALIVAIAKRLRAIVVSDDPHFREIVVATTWYKR